MAVLDTLRLEERCGEARKQYLDGGHRTVPPRETVDRVRPLMARMGITRVANVTGLDRIGIPVVMVCRPNARSIAVSQGKGVDLDAACASGLMEAAELYHAESIEQSLKLASLAELSPTHNLIDVGALPKVKGAGFHPHLVMLWVEGIDLASREPRWVPFESVRANYTLPPPPGSGCFDCTTNGLASGNTLGEAVCHGICEVIERDATTLWNQTSTQGRAPTGVDLDSVSDEICRQLLGRLRQATFDVFAWETTSDVGVPAFFCALLDRRNPGNHIGIGAGAHPARAIALVRALTEAVQVRTTYISGTRDDIGEDEYTEDGRAQKRIAIERLVSESRFARNFEAVPNRVSASFSDDLEWLLGRLRAAGAGETVVVDLSKSDIGLAVVRVVVPGLEPSDDHAGYVPGPRARRVIAGP